MTTYTGIIKAARNIGLKTKVPVSDLWINSGFIYFVTAPYSTEVSERVEPVIELTASLRKPPTVIEKICEVTPNITLKRINAVSYGEIEEPFEEHIEVTITAAVRKITVVSRSEHNFKTEASLLQPQIGLRRLNVLIEPAFTPESVTNFYDLEISLDEM